MMPILLILLQFLLMFPQDNAYAMQVKDRVIITITYGSSRPVSVCTNFYDIEDAEMKEIRDVHCFTPTNDIGDFDEWEHMRLDDGNFEIVITYPTGKITIFLTTKVNT